ncbi:hypothetical protein GP486_007899 [Trichoglossum hirsutum]|uniref:RING-type domain-containing protein n=1 Tax=Trichoglossum hirsutum TaxID=265104 RepID=A0A9P8L6K5_9PEZI|nr:hypothetical protein GP486_007899 [Trichoglossum hirsutum]
MAQVPSTTQPTSSSTRVSAVVTRKRKLEPSRKPNAGASQGSPRRSSRELKPKRRKTANTVQPPDADNKVSNTPNLHASSKARHGIVDGGGESARVKAVMDSPKDVVEEKRLRRFRTSAPRTFNERLERVMTQRMFIIDRNRTDQGGIPEEKFDIAGTTGNIYNAPVRTAEKAISANTSSTSSSKYSKPKGLSSINWHFLLLSELHELFKNAPPAPVGNGSSEEHPGQRKPVEGDCPICAEAFEPGKEEIVWCKAACGQNVHKQCFEQWVASKPGQVVKCIYCRTPWKDDAESIKEIAGKGEINAEGYVNVASQLGLSGNRGKGEMLLDPALGRPSI